MAEKLKVMTIVGTRPEIIRLSDVIKCCDKYFNHILVHTGQNWDYTLNQVFFDNLKFVVNTFIGNHSVFIVMIANKETNKAITEDSGNRIFYL